MEISEFRLIRGGSSVTGVNRVAEGLADLEGLLAPTDGEAEVDGEAETDEETEGLLAPTEGLADLEGLFLAVDGEADAEGLMLALGEIDGEAEPPADGDAEGLSLTEGEIDTEGEAEGL